MLGSKEAEDFVAFFSLSGHQNLDKYYISQSWHELPKNTIRNICSRIMLFPQTLKVITMIYNETSGRTACVFFGMANFLPRGVAEKI